VNKHQFSFPGTQTEILFLQYPAEDNRNGFQLDHKKETRSRSTWEHGSCNIWEQMRRAKVISSWEKWSEPYTLSSEKQLNVC